MKLHEIMNSRPVTAELGTDVTLARHMMIWADVRHLPIIDADRKLHGILSERDVLRLLSRERDKGFDKWDSALVDAVMTVRVQTAGPEDSVTEAAARLAEANIGCLPITDKGELVGIVTRTDILRAEVKQGMAPTTSPLVARDLMTASPSTVETDDYLLDAAGRMQSANVRHLPVVDGSDKLVGILSDRDVRGAIGDPMRVYDDDHRVQLNLLRVSDAMTRDPRSFAESASISELADAFVSFGLSAVPIVGADGKLAGIVSYIDLLRTEP